MYNAKRLNNIKEKKGSRNFVCRFHLLFNNLLTARGGSSYRIALCSGSYWYNNSTTAPARDEFILYF